MLRRNLSDAVLSRCRVVVPGIEYASDSKEAIARELAYYQEIVDRENFIDELNYIKSCKQIVTTPTIENKPLNIVSCATWKIYEPKQETT